MSGKFQNMFLLISIIIVITFVYAYAIQAELIRELKQGIQNGVIQVVQYLNYVYYLFASAKTQSVFSRLLLTIQCKALQLRLLVSKPHHKAYIKAKRQFLASYIDLLEYLVKPLSRLTTTRLLFEIESIKFIDRIEDTLKEFKCDKWKIYPIKSSSIYVECKCEMSLIREIIFIHYCMDMKGIKTVQKYNMDESLLYDSALDHVLID